jgi:hypothetical protein
VRQGHTIVKHIAQHIVCWALLAYTGVMNHHEQAHGPDPTSELINQIIATMGGEAVTQSAANPTAHEESQNESAPVMSLTDILNTLSPGASEDMIAVQRLVRDRLPEIISNLRSCPGIPHPKDIPALYAQHGGEPMLLAQPPTVGEIAAHLKAGTTTEIGLHIFGNDCVLILGSEDETTVPYTWQFVEEKASALIHTHPDAPDDPIGHSHYPSITDLKLAKDSDSPQMVFSAEGILLYPNATDIRAGTTSWREHSFTIPYPNTGDPEQDYNSTRREKDKYLNEVAKVRVIPWDELPPDVPVQEAVAYAVEQRRLQHERGEIGQQR